MSDTTPIEPPDYLAQQVVHYSQDLASIASTHNADWARAALIISIESFDAETSNAAISISTWSARADKSLGGLPLERTGCLDNLVSAIITFNNTPRVVALRLTRDGEEYGVDYTDFTDADLVSVEDMNFAARVLFADTPAAA
jgi:hypothetical protein